MLCARPHENTGTWGSALVWCGLVLVTRQPLSLGPAARPCLQLPSMVAALRSFRPVQASCPCPCPAGGPQEASLAGRCSLCLTGLGPVLAASVWWCFLDFDVGMI